MGKAIILALIVALFSVLAKALYDWITNHSREIEKLRDTTAEYKPNHAIIKGSKEEYRFIAEHKHREIVEPEVKRLHYRSLLWKWSAPLLYFVLILILLCLLWYIS